LWGDLPPLPPSEGSGRREGQRERHLGDSLLLLLLLFKYMSSLGGETRVRLVMF
jgi:hypothetical protein